MDKNNSQSSLHERASEYNFMFITLLKADYSECTIEFISSCAHERLKSVCKWMDLLHTKVLVHLITL